MRSVVFALALLTTTPTLVHAEPWRTTTNAFLFGYAVAAGVDTAETAWCLGKSEAYVEVGRAAFCQEANPLLRPVVKKRGPVAALAVKSLADVGIATAIMAVRDAGHTKAAAFAAIGMFVTQAYIVDRNRRALHISFTVAK
ncbi:MAG: hypothetical protein U0Q11_09935 [Vicinamibacterales bacterium]